MRLFSPFSFQRRHTLTFCQVLRCSLSTAEESLSFNVRHTRMFYKQTSIWSFPDGMKSARWPTSAVSLRLQQSSWFSRCCYRSNDRAVTNNLNGHLGWRNCCTVHVSQCGIPPSGASVRIGAGLSCARSIRHYLLTQMLICFFSLPYTVNMSDSQSWRCCLKLFGCFFIFSISQ